MTNNAPSNSSKSGTSSSVNELRRSLDVAKQATQAAEANFRILVDAVKDYGIFLIDPDGYIQSWNSGAERIKGYTASEIIGQHFSIFYTSADIARDHPRHELELAIKNGRYEEEGWRLRKDGTRFWANILITTLYDENGTHIGFAKVTRDLTERKKTEDQLRLSEERARRMFEDIKDYAIILLKPDGAVASWNEGARRITGYAPSDIIGRHFSTFYPEQDVNMGKCEYELREAAETGRFEDEGWRLRKDGTKFWASVVLTAIRDDRGNLIGYSKVTRDMTDRKRADDLLKMAYSNLEKRVEERTRELLKTNEQLQAAIRSRDEFLSIASHELRTPLTPLKLQIQGLTRAVRHKTFAQFTEQRLERVATTCDKAISRLTGLIDNLLDVSRINTGKLVLNLEAVDLSELAADVLERYKHEIAASGSEITLQAPVPVVGDLDRLRMEQIFLNLLTNSLKYGAQRPVQISITSDATSAVMVFRDNGIGIAQYDQLRIFERFERVASNMNVGGLGLGLYITRQIVEAHRGTITLASTPGVGSTFTVRVPITGA